jgi:hypothetical protein
MSMFIKRPVIVNVEQYHPFSLGDIPGVCHCDSQKDGAHLHTIHKDQVVRLEDGDWVIPEMDGKHFYPCKDSVFQKTYEPYDPAATPELPVLRDESELAQLARNLDRARKKYPNAPMMIEAICEEAGELARSIAMMASIPPGNPEALDLACVALRLYTEGSTAPSRELLNAMMALEEPALDAQRKVNPNKRQLPRIDPEMKARIDARHQEYLKEIEPQLQALQDCRRITAADLAITILPVRESLVQRHVPARTTQRYGCGLCGYLKTVNAEFHPDHMVCDVRSCGGEMHRLPSEDKEP